MMPNIQIQKDLLDLYCKIKQSSVENLLIKVSESNNLSIWLKRNDKNIREKIENSNVIFTLSTLSGLRQAVPRGQRLEREWIVRNMFDVAQRIYPVISAFATVPSLEILAPYDDLIASLSTAFRMTPAKSKNESDILEQEKSTFISDINIINKMYVEQLGELGKKDTGGEGKEGKEERSEKTYQRKPNIKQQRKDMFMALLKRFSDDIANAYESKGLSDIAQKFKGGILIKDPSSGVGSLFKIDMLSSQELGIIPILVDFIWKNYDIRRLEYNHGAIKTYLLNRVGVMTSEDFASIYAEHEKNKNSLEFLENLDSDYPGLNLKEKVTIDNEMNPRYVYLLSVFLNKLMSKITMQ
jgi:hypothetical protein